LDCGGFLLEIRKARAGSNGDFFVGETEDPVLKKFYTEKTIERERERTQGEAEKRSSVFLKKKGVSAKKPKKMGKRGEARAASPIKQKKRLSIREE